MSFFSDIVSKMMGMAQDALAKSFQSQQGQPEVKPLPTIIPIAQQKNNKLIIDQNVRTKYAQGWQNKPRTKPIETFVVHGTAGGTTADSMIQWMMGTSQGAERGAEYMQGIALFHYLIDRDGEQVEIISPNFWVYHSSSGAVDQTTCGTELLNPDKSNVGPYTEDQYLSLVDLIVRHLLPLYPSMKHIVGHGIMQARYSPSYGYKTCPGPGFSFDKLKKMMVQAGCVIDREAPEEFWIK